MARACLEFHGVTFIYDSAAEAVFEGLSALLPPGWTGVIGPNGAGKTTLLRLASGLLRPQRGQVRVPGPVVCCPQRTDDPPDHLAAMLAALDPEACALRGQLGLEDDWLARWATLSHGERKRAQIGVALWRRPAVLAVDEPTNHIDADARALLLRAMRGFDGVGLLVSHDRELLDGLCAQCLFLEPPSATLRPGGYTKAVALAAAEQEHLRHAREQARRDLRRLEREASSRRSEAAGADRKRSKRHLARGDSDGREKLDRARVTGKDGQAGRILRQMEGRVEQAQDRLAQVRVRKQRSLGLELRGEVSPRNVLAHLPAGRIPLGERRALEHPELRVTPADRIAVVGPNGSGKSTLIGRLVGTLDLPPERLVYMAQELDRGHARELLTEARGLPPERLGEVLSAVDSLGSDPKRLLATDEPSPGEVRKLLLALGLARRPHLLVLDEPTNHLDLPSIECLERALSDCPAALVLVSHDRRFLGALAQDRWVLSPHPGGSRLEVRPGAP